MASGRGASRRGSRGQWKLLLIALSVLQLAIAGCTSQERTTTPSPRPESPTAVVMGTVSPVSVAQPTSVPKTAATPQHDLATSTPIPPSTPAATATPAVTELLRQSPTPAPLAPTSTVAAAAAPLSTPTRAPAPSGDRVEALLARMTLRQKVGQLLMFGFGGTTPESAARIIREYQPGSIVFYQNTTSPAQTAALTSGLQQMARSAGAGVPLFIAIDHEGGYVQRLRNGVTYFPSKLVLGATHDPALARLEGEVEGRELRALGINMNLGPVLDVDSNPRNPIIGGYHRSLGSDPAAVTRLGLAYIDGLQAQRVVAVAKHFPGHGGTGEDSHVVLPTLNRSRAELERVDLPPFRAAVPRVGAIMTAHIVFPALDARWPASLSRVFVDDLLRTELGYEGLIMTDDTGGMAAITDNYDPGAAALRSVLAGSDLVMVVGDSSRQARAFAALLDAAEQNVLPAERIDASVRRILRTKAAYGLLDSVEAPRPSAAPDPGGQQAVQRIVEGAITLVRDEAAQVPVGEGQGQRVLVISSPDRLPSVENGTLLGQQIRQRRPQTREVLYRFGAGADNQTALDQALAQARDADLVVVGTVDAGPWQQELVRRLRQQGARPVVVGFGRPYEVAGLPPDVAYLAAYSTRPDSVVASVRVLFGEIPARGRLPVAVPGLYPAGYSASQRGG